MPFIFFQKMATIYIHIMAISVYKVRFTTHQLAFLVSYMVSEADVCSKQVLLNILQITRQQSHYCLSIYTIFRTLHAYWQYHLVILVELDEHFSCALHLVAPFVQVFKSVVLFFHNRLFNWFNCYGWQ